MVQVQVTVGSLWGTTAWLTLDCVIAAFVDPLTAEKGHMVSITTPLVTLPNTVTWERRWNWEWVTTRAEEAAQAAQAAKAAAQAAAVDGAEGSGEESPAAIAPAVGEDEGDASVGALLLPAEPGTWKRLPCRWDSTNVIYFPLPTAVDGEEGQAIDAVKAAGTASSFVVCVSNHLSLPGQYTPSDSRIVLRKLSDQSEIVLSTSTTTSLEVQLEQADTTLNGGGSSSSRMYEIIADTPAGASVTFCSSATMELLDYSTARRDVLKESMSTVQGVIAASSPNQMNVPFRVHFEVPPPIAADEDAAVDGDVAVKEDNADNADNAASVDVVTTIQVDCALTVHDTDVRPFVNLFIIDEDSGKEEIIPLQSFRNKVFALNHKGYTVMATLRSSNDVELPSSPFTLTLLSKQPLANVTQHTVDNTMVFKGDYIPNKYYRLLRDVISTAACPEGQEPLPEPVNEEGTLASTFCPYASLDFKVSWDVFFSFLF